MVADKDSPVIIERVDVDALVDNLRELGYRIIAPTVRDGAIVYDEIDAAAELPAGWTDRQDAGTYRLERRADDALFGYAVGPHSWKRYLFPPVTSLWKARRSEGGFEVVEEDDEAPRLAFFGVRPCDLHAIFVQDRVFMGSKYVDRTYAGRRANAFIVVVNCGHPSGTCFCVSMGTGPRADDGFDLALTEVLEDGRHYFVAEAGSEQGREVLDRVPHSAAEPAEVKAGEQVTADAAERMGRHMETDGIKGLLYRNYEHPRWDDVASRCLACTNCTMVCPTCFCSTVEDVTDLAGEQAERVRKWDSCFTADHSYIHGGSVRPSIRSRYRQWMTHKLATWIDQFETSGCVGCGRCVTWCPVGIDITEEVAAIRASDGAATKEEGDHHADA